MIQRDYSQISQFDYYNHRETTPPKKDDIKHSDIGRIVYGGGGIAPDYVVEEPKVNDFQTLLVSKFAFYTFARDFLAKNPPVDRSFQVSDAMIEQFKQHALKRGYDLSAQRAMQVEPAHFHEYDYILAMDRTHLRALKRMAPPGARARVGLFLEASEHWHGEDVPDPYYGGADDFERVLDMVEEAADRWLDRVQAELDPATFRLQGTR